MVVELSCFDGAWEKAFVVFSAYRAQVCDFAFSICVGKTLLDPLGSVVYDLGLTY